MLISQALHQTLPAPAAENSSFQCAFELAADLLLNQAVLHVGSQPHRLVEIEFYWTGPDHEDPFTHCDAMQKEFGLWYFHKVGHSYKGGTYKGLDIAIGGPDRYAGILVRGIEPLQNPDALCDGSCSCVDRMLEVTGHASIVSLVGTFDICIDAPVEGKSSPLFLEMVDAGAEKKTVFRSPRVGLSLKKGVTLERCSYLARNYRFLTEPARIKKGRPNLVIGMYGEGRSVHEISELTEVSVSNVKKYVEAFEQGKGQDPAKYSKDLSTDGLCELLGALAAKG